MNKDTRKISVAGLFIAISIILSRIFAGDYVVGGLTTLRVSFGPVPIYLGGILLGPVYGAAIGVLSDTLGYLVKPTGPYFFGFAINAALTGAIPALINYDFQKKKSWWGLLLVVILVEFITSIILTPLWLSIITGKTFMAFMTWNILTRFFLVPAYVALIKAVLKISKQVIPSLK